MFFTYSFITKKRDFGKLYDIYLYKLKIALMTEEINQKKSLNPIADRVEKRTKEISIKSEKLINYGLDTLKDLMFKLLEVRPREYKTRDYRPREYRKKDSRDKE